MGCNHGGGKMSLILNAYENYTFEGLRDLILKKYVNEDNKKYFEECNIDFGSFDGRIFTSFVLNDKPLNFWNFCNAFGLRKGGNYLNIYIFTTKKQQIAKSNEEIETLESKSCRKRKTEISMATTSRKLTRIAQNSSEAGSSLISTYSNRNSVSSPQYSVPTKLSHYSPICGETTSEIAKNSNFTNPAPSLSVSQDLVASKANTVEKSNYAKTRVDNENTSTMSTFFRPMDRTDVKIDSLTVPLNVIKKDQIRLSSHMLGEGAQGIVVKGKYMDFDVAVKCIQKGKQDKYVLREIALLSQIRMPNIIGIIGVASTLTQIYIIMEYFDSESLFSIIFDKDVRAKYNIKLNDKCKIAYQIARAINFLHSRTVPIIHRDIKPNNVLVNSNLDIKLCDLGLASSKQLDSGLQSSRKDHICGTYLFLAPEIILKKEEACTSSDIWSFACTVIELFTEKSVWDTKDFNNAFSCAVSNLEKGHVPAVDKLPIFLQCIFSKCFNYNNNLRPSITEIVNLFEKLVPK